VLAPLDDAVLAPHAERSNVKIVPIVNKKGHCIMILPPRLIDTKEEGDYAVYEERRAARVL
jgi:hypothetical protein